MGNLELALEPYFSDDLTFEEILSSKFDSTYPTSSFTDRDAAGISDDSTIFSGSTSTSTQTTDFAPGSGPLFNPGEKTPGQIFVDPHGHRSSIIRSSPPAWSEQSRITVPNLALISSSVEPETFPLDCYSDDSLHESYSLRSGIPAAFFGPAPTEPSFSESFPSVFDPNSCAFCWEPGHAPPYCPKIASLRRKPVSSGCFTSNSLSTLPSLIGLLILPTLCIFRSQTGLLHI